MPDPSTEPVPLEVQFEVWAAIQKLADHLDNERFDRFLDGCQPNLSYRIVTTSPELGKDMTFMDLEGDEMKTLLSTVADHVRPPNKLLRHTDRPSMQALDGARVASNAKVSIFHVTGSGEPNIYALGRYEDVFSLTEAGPILLTRDVVLASRRFPFGSHVPL